MARVILFPVLAGLLVLGMLSPAEALEIRKGAVLDCGAELRLYVGRVEKLAKGLSAVHVQMFEGDNRVAGHLPFAPEAFRSCKGSSLPASIDFDSARFNEGVSEWRSAKGGVFTVSPKDVRQILKEMTGG